MELTPQLLAEVEFRDTLRGYDRDEVDTFLEQVGVAIAQLQGRLREAIARAEVAESRSGGGEGVSTDTITRTLLLAQRTADATVAEAETDAVRMVEEAREESARLRSEAESDRAAVLAETENEARQVAEDARRDLLNELSQLESTRDDVRAEADALAVALQAERSRLLDAAGELVALAQSGVLGEGPTESDLGDQAVEHAGAGHEPTEAPDVVDATVDEGHADRLDDGDTERVAADIDLSESAEATGSVADEPVDLADAPDETGDRESSTARLDPEPGSSVFGAADTGSATQAVDVLALDDAADEPDDVFVQQLRQAVSPTGDREGREGEALADFFEEDEGPRRLFGRKSD